MNMQPRLSLRGKVIVALVLVYASYLGYLTAYALIVKRRNPDLSESLIQKRNRSLKKTVKNVKENKDKYKKAGKEIATLLFT